MNPRQRYAITHPLDEAHLDRMAHCTRTRELAGLILCTILAVDR